jgi:hypothetical protein
LLDSIKEKYNFTENEKKQLLCRVNSAFSAAHSKLSKYVVDGAQPASKFLDQIRILDPTNLVDLDHDINVIDSIPGFEEVTKEEWDLYVNHLSPIAVKASKDGKLDLPSFWKSKASILPELYKLASCYSTTTIGSYDVERLFSAYNDILDDKRRSLDESTIKAFHFLNWNLRVKSSIAQEMEKQRSSLNVSNKTSKETTVKIEKVKGDESDFPRVFRASKQSHQGPTSVQATEEASTNTATASQQKKKYTVDSDESNKAPKRQKTCASKQSHQGPTSVQATEEASTNATTASKQKKKYSQDSDESKKAPKRQKTCASPGKMSRMSMNKFLDAKSKETTQS